MSCNKSTFNLPDLSNNNIPLGICNITNLGRYTNGIVPNITGSFGNDGDYSAFCMHEFIPRGAIGWSGEQRTCQLVGNSSSTASICTRLTINASKSSSVYSDGVTMVTSHGVMMPYIIQYT